MKCPECGSENTLKVISFGLPLKLCDDCNTVWGEPFATFHGYVLAPIESMFQDGFFFMPYEGSYWDALMVWLFTSDEEK